MKYIKSPLNYTGGKYKILKDIIPAFKPNIDTFVDLFAGGFNVGINVEANTIICHDQIDYVIDLYKMLQTIEINELIEKIKKRIDFFRLSKENKEGYLNLRMHYNQSKDLLDLFILTCYSFNHQIRFNNNHQFNTPFGQSRSSYNSNIENNLIHFCSALKQKNIVFKTGDFANFDFDKIKANDFVYCDPPYLISTGSYNDGKRGFKDWTKKEETELLSILDYLDSKNIDFALSNVLYHKGLSNNILIEWCKKYNVSFIDKKYSNCNYQFKQKAAKTVEVLITNFEKQDNSYIQTSLF